MNKLTYTEKKGKILIFNLTPVHLFAILW